jgi:urea carboxylase
MFGVAAAPIYDPRQTLADFADSAVLFRPGDVVTYTPVTEERYREIQAEVAAGTWRYDLRPVTVDLAAAVADPRAYNERLLEAPRVP